MPFHRPFADRSSMTGPAADHRAEDQAGPIDLSVTQPFRLGPLEVRPPTREVRDPQGGLHLVEPRVMQVLTALAQAHRGVVSRDVLVARCWEGRIVGDDAIHRAVAKARLLADLAAPPAFAIEAIARVGYRLLEAEAAAPAEPSAAAEGGSPPPRFDIGRRGWLAGGAALVAVGAASYAGWRWLPHGARPEPLVAVLPFDNLSPDPQLGYFADGLSEDVLNTLTRGGEMRVTSRTSSFTFRGPAKAKAGEALKADYLLDGSVFREGDRLRVNVQLTDVAARQTLWSQTYDRDVAQGVQIEDEIAGRVAQALKVRFEAQPAGRHIDPVAFDLYLRGREATGQHDPASLQTGAELLRQAVAMAPSFAPAWFELARNYWRNGFLAPVPDQARLYRLSREAAERALALDPKNGAALGLQAQVTPLFHHWAQIDTALVRGLKLSPNDPNLLTWRAHVAQLSGRLSLAVDLSRRARALDPFDVFPSLVLTQALTYQGQFPETLALLDQMREVFPKELATFWNRFYLFFAMGRDADALAVLQDSNRPYDPGIEYEVLAQTVRALASGAAAERAAAVRAQLQLCGQGVGYAANALIALGRLGAFNEILAVARSLYLGSTEVLIDRTVQFLGNSRYPPHGEPGTEALFHPLLRPLRQSGRLKPVFDGIGLTDFWRATGPADP